MLVMKHLAKRYGARMVVKDVSFSLQRGQVVGILGPNGAGKTTSFYMVMGIVLPDAGTVHIDGKDITRLPMHTRARLGIGYLPQEASVFATMSVYDNVRAIAELCQPRHLVAKICNDLIEEFSLTKVAHTLGRALSGGERRRCEIARCLAASPSFVLLDEPFAGVDPISVGEIRTVIATLKARGLGVLITDHNVQETLAICDSATIIFDGTAIAHGTPQDIVQDKMVKQVYLGEHFCL